MSERIKLGETWKESALLVGETLSDLKEGQEKIEAKLPTKTMMMFYGALGGALGASLGSEIVSVMFQKTTGLGK